MKRYIILCVLFTSLFAYKKNELNIVGNAFFGDGLGRLPIALIHTLKNDLKIKFISTYGKSNLVDVPEEVKNILIESDNSIGPVSVLFSAPWHIGGKPYTKIPDNTIKLAYSMLEASAIPDKWVEVLNNYFDAVVVPDNFLVDVYKDSGVEIPIFVLPCILFLNDFLKEPLRIASNDKPFTFGISAAFGVEKNHDIVIEAFAREFGNNPTMKLRVHGRWGNPDSLRQKIKDMGLENVELIQKTFLHEEYIEFLRSLDCYVLLSRGEGFSITPREALALGIPCILTNHTAHKTICDAGFAVPVKAEIPTSIYYAGFDAFCGYQLTCTIKDAQIAMNEVYINYDKYLAKSCLAREWVKQYLPDQQRQRYLNLVRPKKLIFGALNIVTNEYLMTNSSKLFEKYNKVFGKDKLKNK